MLILGRVRNDNRILLIIKGARNNETAIERIVFQYFHKKALLRVKNTTEDSIEFIYELTRKTYHITYQKERSITQELYDLKNIFYVNIVSQNDEISG